MKAMKTLLLTCILSIAVVVHASDYPFYAHKQLPNQLMSTTIVNLVGDMQTALIEFTGAGWPLGSVQLSPIQLPGTNRKYQAGEQVLIIEEISFQSASDSNPGTVQCTGSITDPDGNNKITFSEILAEWENNSP